MRFPLILVLVPASFGPGATAAWAQGDPHSPAPAIEGLRRALDQQEAVLESQSREIEQLRRRLEQMEQLLARVAPAGPVQSAPAPASDRSAAAPDQGRALPELAARQPEVEDLPGAFQIPGSDAKLRIGGQIRTLVVRNIGAVGTDDRFVTSSIPVEGTPEADKTSRTTLSSSPSRFNFEVRTPSSVGPIRAFIEGDFAGSGMSYRLRHALGHWHDFLVGQTRADTRPLLRGGGHVQAAYLVRQIRGEPVDSINHVLSTAGTGYHVSGRLPVRWRRSDFLTFATALGPGIGRYITDLVSEGGQDAVYDPSTASLRALFAQSHYVCYEHWWTDSLRSTGTFGFVRVSNLEVQAEDALYQTTAPA